MQHIEEIKEQHKEDYAEVIYQMQLDIEALKKEVASMRGQRAGLSPSDVGTLALLKNITRW